MGFKFTIQKLCSATAKRLDRFGSRLTTGANNSEHHSPRLDCCAAPSAQFMSTAVVDNFRKNAIFVKVGAGTVVRGQLMIFGHGGNIEIGAHCYVGEGARIWSAESIVIGNRVLISHGVNIHDTDSHPIDKELRHQHYQRILSQGHPMLYEFNIISRRIEIEDDVWIGFGAAILKGVRIGKGSIIAACSVVTHDIPARVIAGGNPTKIMRQL